MVGGVAGFVGAAFIGPRHGMEKNKKNRKNLLEDPEFNTFKKSVKNEIGFVDWMLERDNEPFEQHSFPFVVFGTIILWVSWLFFNGGSTASMF